MAVAFLFNEKNEILLLRKRKDASFLSDFLVPIGGHIESSEFNSPKNACLREIEEETGLINNNIKSLKLKYIVHRIVGNWEIRTQYVFCGDVSIKTKLIESEEGQLEWFSYKDIIADNDTTATTKEIIKHYQEKKIEKENIYIGSMKSDEGFPSITWCVLKDWEN